LKKSLNHAAERAIPVARDLLVNVISALHFDDVHRIWKGGLNAISDFFRGRSSLDLKKAFRPLITKTMDACDVTRHWKHIVDATKDIPLLSKHTNACDVEEYTSEKTVDGLFHVMGEEEQKVRSDPASQVTHMLKVLFGGDK